jgi:twitching motility protein PilU
MNVKPLFKLMVEKKASDLFFAPFSPAKIKIEGKIMPVNKLEMTPKMVKQAAIELMNDEQLEHFYKELEIDFAISDELPNLEELGMPEQLKELTMLRRGLILMVGATGAGKSTTLAAMIDYRNEKTSSHIITIEDPIEFLHPNKQSIVNQREVGLDTKSYGRALKSAVRAAPDVIQIGEIRDRESMHPTTRQRRWTVSSISFHRISTRRSSWTSPTTCARSCRNAWCAHATASAWPRLNCY